jgi:hypothetical protein
MAKQKTIREYFEEILTAYDLTDEHRDFVEKRLAALSKKTTDRKPTATQIANENLAVALHEHMLAVGGKHTVSSLMKSAPCFAEIEGLSQSKANSIVKKLKDSGRVVRTEEKGVAYFEAKEVEGE